jgi:hypothetical protein
LKRPLLVHNCIAMNAMTAPPMITVTSSIVEPF